MRGVDVYVVRIYRRTARDSSMLAGVVEIINGGHRQSFKSLDELCAILQRSHASCQGLVISTSSGKSKG